MISINTKIPRERTRLIPKKSNILISQAAHAESLGADSLLCLPELYFKPCTAHELVDYLKLVGQAAPSTPLLYYDFPKATSVNSK